MEDPYCHLELATFRSISKGYVAEGGFRIGFCEVLNMDPQVLQYLQTYLATYTSVVAGQVNCCINT